MPRRIVTASAPGKVLFAGGYLVLERPNPGVVLACGGCGDGGAGGEARFYATVTAKPPATQEGDREPVGGDDEGVGGGKGGLCGERGPRSFPLDVYSPQFDSVFRYQLECGGSSDAVAFSSTAPEIRLLPRYPSSHVTNAFVERALTLSLAYIRLSAGPDEFDRIIDATTRGGEVALSVKLRADNDFYSQVGTLRSRGMDLTPGNVSALEPFVPCPKVTDGATGEEKLVVNKTGMGSSAALVTSLVGALLRYFGVVSLPGSGEGGGGGGDREAAENGLRICHNLAQVCHCSAQGKVGSGFDVSAAVWGSHVYRRFSKSVLAPLLDRIEANQVVAKAGGACAAVTGEVAADLLGLVSDPQQSAWDCGVVPLRPPQGIDLLLADVCGGSESPSMARRVLSWKAKAERTKAGAAQWDQLGEINHTIESIYLRDLPSPLVKRGIEQYGPLVLSKLPAKEWPSLLRGPPPTSMARFDSGEDVDALRSAIVTLLDLRRALLTARRCLKSMGEAAGEGDGGSSDSAVPIEPDSQTELANATMALPGVIAAGVPGAGGFDALFVLYVKGTPTGDGDRSDEARDRIGELWRDRGGSGTESGGTGEKEDAIAAICPLAARAGGHGGTCGLREQSDFGW